MNYRDLKRAREILGISERATLREIRTRYRSLVKQHHPDAVGAQDSDAIREINAAHRLLMNYLADYRFSFTEDEFYEQNPEERLRRQFMEDPFWGGIGSK